MIKLLFFVPCMRVLEDSRDKTLTLSAIVEEVRLQGESLDDIGERIVVNPMTWSGVAYWQCEPGQQGKYEFCIAISLPDDSVQKTPIQTFEVVPGKMRTIIHVNGFPHRFAGRHTIGLQARGLGSTEWEEVASYPIDVIHEIDPSINQLPGI